MKKFVIILTLFAVLFAPTTAVLAQENPDYEETALNSPWRKGARGVINVLTAPVEIPKQVRIAWKETADKDFAESGMWIFTGFLRGLVNTVGRAGSGIWDVVSAPFNCPKGYEPLMKPDYVLQDFSWE